MSRVAADLDVELLGGRSLREWSAANGRDESPSSVGKDSVGEVLELEPIGILGLRIADILGAE